MMELPNHLVPWDTVKELLKQAKRDAWEEGYDAGTTDSANYEDLRDGYDHHDDYEETPNPYQEDE